LNLINILRHSPSLIHHLFLSTLAEEMNNGIILESEDAVYISNEKLREVIMYLDLCSIVNLNENIKRMEKEDQDSAQNL
jgi:hypothetical protein